MLQLARTIVLREQELAKREHELAKLRAEFTRVAAESEQMDLPIGDPSPTTAEQLSRLALGERPALARAHGMAATASLTQRVIGVLDLEPRAFGASEVATMLEMTHSIDTIRTTLSKLFHRGMIARPQAGQYCALQYESVVRQAAGAA